MIRLFRRKKQITSIELHSTVNNGQGIMFYMESLSVWPGTVLYRFSPNIVVSDLQEVSWTYKREDAEYRARWEKLQKVTAELANRKDLWTPYAGDTDLLIHYSDDTTEKRRFGSFNVSKMGEFPALIASFVPEDEPAVRFFEP